MTLACPLIGFRSDCSYDASMRCLLGLLTIAARGDGKKQREEGEIYILVFLGGVWTLTGWWGDFFLSGCASAFWGYLFSSKREVLVGFYILRIDCEDGCMICT